MKRQMIVTVPQLGEENLEAIRAAADKNGFEAHFFAGAAEALPALAEAEIAFGAAAELARNAPKLKWLCTPSAGVNQFLGEGVFAAPDAVLTNSSGAYGTTIAEHIIMVTLDMMRRAAEYREVVARRGWVRSLHVHSIRDARITLLGTGDIGQEAVLRLRAFFPARIIGVNRSGKNPKNLFDEVVPVSEMERILPETDLFILSLPETPETIGLLTAERLALLPESAYLVNVGRGSVLDETALEAMLRAGKLAGAALDVFAREPLPQDSSLWECPRLLLTPHVAGNMTLDYTVARIAAMFLEDFAHYCAGEPLVHTVDRQLGY